MISTVSSGPLPIYLCAFSLSRALPLCVHDPASCLVIDPTYRLYARCIDRENGRYPGIRLQELEKEVTVRVYLSFLIKLALGSPVAYRRPGKK